MGQPTVIVIDDDAEIRETLGDLLQSVGLHADLFASVQEFQDCGHPERPGCIVLDVRLPGRSGLDFQDDLVNAKIRLPIVFISGHADVPMSVRAMKAGAVEFLTKPVRHQELLDAIQAAIERDRGRRNDESSDATIQNNFDKLTQRERQVLALVVSGRANKQIAVDLGISTTTVKLHRGQMMRKMQAPSLPELVKMAGRLSHLKT